MTKGTHDHIRPDSRWTDVISGTEIVVGGHCELARTGESAVLFRLLNEKAPVYVLEEQLFFDGRFEKIEDETEEEDDE